MLDLVIMLDNENDKLFELSEGDIDSSYLDLKDKIDDFLEENFEMVAFIIYDNLREKIMPRSKMFVRDLKAKHKLYTHVFKSRDRYTGDSYNDYKSAIDGLWLTMDDYQSQYSPMDLENTRAGYVTTICFDPKKDTPIYIEDMFEAASEFIDKTDRYSLGRLYGVAI